jgi:ribulose-phosphate 3-epimerase
MTEIIPAILAKNYDELKNKISLVRGVVPVVQIDICDGVFAKDLTWPFLSRSDVGTGEEFLENNLDQHFRAILNEREGLPFWEDVDFELDLMVADAVQNFDIYSKLGPRRIIFHVEAVGDLEEFKNFLEGMDSYVRDVIEIGVAINPSTPLDHIFPVVNNVDFVQCMGSDDIGHSGVKLDTKVYENVKILREKYSDLPISVDIGVNRDTAPLLVEAGVTKLVCGSAIFNTDDIIGTIEELRNF